MYHVIQTRRHEDRTLVSSPSVVVPSDAVFKMHVSCPPSRSIAHIPATRCTETKKHRQQDIVSTALNAPRYIQVIGARTGALFEQLICIASSLSTSGTRAWIASHGFRTRDQHATGSRIAGGWHPHWGLHRTGRKEFEGTEKWPDSEIIRHSARSVRYGRGIASGPMRT